jgi:protein-tyrosine phosphatase
MNAFIDIHHHLLYGMDDGPSDREGTERMLGFACQQGVGTIIVTPHFTPGIDPFSPDTLHQRVEEAKAICVAAGYDLRVYPGVEMLYTFQAERYLSQQRVPTLAGSNKILIEFSPDIRFDDMETAVQSVLRSGYFPILAHIERYPSLLHGRNAERLKGDYDVFYQVNSGFVLNGEGFFAKRAIKRLLTDGKIDFIASDAHDVERRPCQMEAAYNALVAQVGERYADELTGNHMTVEEYLSD